MQQIRLNELRFILFFLGISVLISGCNEEEEIPFESMELNLDFQRFDVIQWQIASELKNNPEADKNGLYRQYLAPNREFIVSWLYNGQDSLASDSLIQADMIDFFLSDPAVAALMDSVHDHYPENYPFEERLEKPLKRFQYYFPDMPLPQFRTFVTGYPPSGMQGLDQIQVTGNYLGFGLHYFMGENFPFYPPDLPTYLRRRMDPEYFETMLFQDFGKKIIPDIEVWENPRLIDRVIRAGMRLYFLDQMLPFTPDSVKISYTSEQMYWASYWEGRIYAELLPHLYSTDFAIQEEYLAESPFTRKLSRESAPRIGDFCGWMIIRQYMDKNPELSLRELLQLTDYDAIVKQAAYRPEIPGS